MHPGALGNVSCAVVSVLAPTPTPFFLLDLGFVTPQPFSAPDSAMTQSGTTPEAKRTLVHPGGRDGTG